VEALCFQVVHCVYVRVCVHPGKPLLARYLTNQWPEFHQTLVDDAIENTVELIKF